MIYVAQCLKDVEVRSLRLKLKQGQTFDCTKAQYDASPELKSLVSSGIIALKIKNNPPSRLGVHSNNRFQIVRESKVVKEVVEKPVVVEKVVEKEVVIEKQAEQPQLDMNALASVLIQQLGTMISPEAIAEAVAKQIPAQQVVVNNNAQTSQSMGNMNTTDEGLTFIPSNIISSKTIASSESLANETKSEGSDELSDALSALKALRKANKQ
tara:strand:- start:270 stop:902 length:633 start_codon:yes stop_codon:yes gene_type:complete